MDMNMKISNNLESIPSLVAFEKYLLVKETTGLIW